MQNYNGENEDLNLHVALCAERYKGIEDKYESVVNRLNQLDSKIDKLKFIPKKKETATKNIVNDLPKSKNVKLKKPTGKDALNPEKVAQYNEELKKLMEESKLKRLEKLRLEGNKPNKTVKLIEKEGKQRRETKTKFNTFGLTSNNRGKKRNPPKGGWV